MSETAENALKAAGFDLSNLATATWIRAKTDKDVDVCVLREDGLFDIGFTCDMTVLLDILKLVPSRVERDT